MAARCYGERDGYLVAICMIERVPHLDEWSTGMSWTERDTENSTTSTDLTGSALLGIRTAAALGSLREGTGRRWLGLSGRSLRGQAAPARGHGGSAPGRHDIDIGCGNGTRPLLAAGTGAAVTGIVISAGCGSPTPRRRPRYIQTRLPSSGGEARVDLPFAAETFTHILSQANLYHASGGAKRALVEIARVLRDGGSWPSMTLVQPREQVSDPQRLYAHDRLLFPV